VHRRALSGCVLAAGLAASSLALARDWRMGAVLPPAILHLECIAEACRPAAALDVIAVDRQVIRPGASAFTPAALDILRLVPLLQAIAPGTRLLDSPGLRRVALPDGRAIYRDRFSVELRDLSRRGMAVAALPLGRSTLLLQLGGERPDPRLDARLDGLLAGLSPLSQQAP
jgi:hypothetical protein